MVSFSVSKSSISKVFKHLKVGLRRNKTRALSTICEVTITDNKATFSVPGAVFSIQCKNIGVAKFTIPLLYFEDIVKNHPEKKLVFSLHNKEIELGKLAVRANVCFIEDDRILRTIDLPLNYTDKDLFALLNNKGYTNEELTFNNVYDQISIIRKQVDKDILSAHKILKKYNVSLEEIKSIVLDRFWLKSE